MLKVQRLILLLIPTTVFANNGLNLQLPSPISNYSYDEIRSQDGMSCKNAIGGATNVEFGMTGIVNNAGSPFDPDPDQSKDIGLYARITIPLDKPKERLNCNSLYQLELRKKRLEVLKLEQEIQRLKNMKFENGQQRN